MNNFVPVFAGLLAAIGSYALTARAGVKHSVPVSITTFGTATIVRGQLGSVRNSSNNTERIECGLSSGAIRVTCEARDATGLTRACAATSGDDRIIEVVGSMSGDAIVEWEQETLGPGHCDQIEVYHGSNLAPKVL
jgi:hypothetical protein